MARRPAGATRGALTLVEAAAEPPAADFVAPWLAALLAEDRAPATVRAYHAAVRGFPTAAGQVVLGGAVLHLCRGVPGHLGYMLLFGLTLGEFALGTALLRRVRGVR